MAETQNIPRSLNPAIKWAALALAWLLMEIAELTAGLARRLAEKAARRTLADAEIEPATIVISAGPEFGDLGCF
jgi:hypothetical protein